MHKAKIRIMLADDHALVRAGLRMLLKSEPNFEVVAEASNGKEILDKLYAISDIDILLLDISMPQESGMDCIRQIKAIRPEIRIIIVSMHEDETYIKKAIELGAAGYIPKASADTELFEAIGKVHKGYFYLSHKANQRLLSSFAPVQAEQDAVESLLSPRELEVLKLIVRGHTATEIGQMLNLSVKTIDTHKTHIMEKLNCQRKSQLVDIALKVGILKNDS